MCGIVGAVSKREVAPILIEGLKRLEYRGYDSAGLSTVEDGSGLTQMREVGKVIGLEAIVAESEINGKLGIAHTRWATHGKPSKNNAHPHVSSDEISVVHNGIIENFQEIKDFLANEGYEFQSETDSEVIPHLIHYHFEAVKDLLEAVRQSVKQLRGAYAVGVIHKEHQNKLIAARSGSPLVVGKGIGENFIASDVLALKPVTDKFIYLEEGDLIELSPEDISIWNIDDESVVRSSVQVLLGPDSMDKGNYRHYMQKEIFEQPKSIMDTLEGRIGLNGLLIESFGVGAASIFETIENVTLVACGTSYYAALVASYWLEELAKIPCQVEIASEFRYRTVVCRPNSLFVTISQSGETADTLAALRLAKELGFASTLTICNVATSSLVRESDLALMINAGVEIGVASTKAYTAQLVDLLLLTLALAKHNGLSGGKESEIVSELHKLPNLIEACLGLDAEVKGLSNEFIDRDHALFLGRGSMYPVALEGALKLKEISYIHAEGYAAGELKHGPLALVDEEMPVVAVAPNDELLEKLQSNLHEVRARGSHLYVFAAQNAVFTEEDGITIVRVPEVSSLMAPIVYVVPLQMLAYHVAVGKGTDVDQPRNLAKSVTVE